MALNQGRIDLNWI